ncbi:argininosuccinate lyase [Actinoplanes sp. TFC3]|uniref:argininosuccinate lyase n=1 Tax=Actinoplanes sp. TFC3 TaxID=1710355 RepID=UPI0008368DC3|nr:argininosuccinate lyase [Actinoplanes sp. TFC3]
MSTHIAPRRAPGTSGLDTGRLHTGLAAEAHRIVYDQYLPEAPGLGGDGLGEELRLISEVDRAHLVMLSERGIVAAPRAAALLTAIGELRQVHFAPIHERPMPRGVYLAYESWLVEQLGEETGGVLHTGRSRNDLNATTARLRTRGCYAPLLAAVEELAEVLLDRAEEYRAVTMPAYTHGQPAVPITYGHYLAGVGHAVLRGLSGLLSAGEELDINPLGAGAVGGTSVAIDTRRTSRLLGFAGPSLNSVDAVASRDFSLRLLSAATVLGVVLARAARDFSSWTSEELALIRLGDDLVGSSSMMPQKRNPFLLEHIQGRATRSLGAFTAAASAMATAPYSNAIAVSNEAMRHVQPALRATADAVTLLRLVVAGAVPDADRMTARAVDGFTSATYLAEQLVASGVPFRSAHHIVGRTVLSALETSGSLTEATRDVPEIAHVAAADPSGEWLQPALVAQACSYGGGPGTDSGAALREELTALRVESAARSERWTTAARHLDEVVSGLIGES